MFVFAEKLKMLMEFILMKKQKYSRLYMEKWKDRFYCVGLKFVI